MKYRIVYPDKEVLEGPWMDRNTQFPIDCLNGYDLQGFGAFFPHENGEKTDYRTFMSVDQHDTPILSLSSSNSPISAVIHRTQKFLDLCEMFGNVESVSIFLMEKS